MSCKIWKVTAEVFVIYQIGSSPAPKYEHAQPTITAGHVMTVKVPDFPYSSLGVVVKWVQANTKSKFKSTSNPARRTWRQKESFCLKRDMQVKVMYIVYKNKFSPATDKATESFKSIYY